MIYGCNVNVCSPDPKTHLKHLEMVLQCLLKGGLTLKGIK